MAATAAVSRSDVDRANAAVLLAQMSHPAADEACGPSSSAAASSQASPPAVVAPSPPVSSLPPTWPLMWHQAALWQQLASNPAAMASLLLSAGQQPPFPHPAHAAVSSSASLSLPSSTTTLSSASLSNTPGFPPAPLGQGASSLPAAAYLAAALAQQSSSLPTVSSVSSTTANTAAFPGKARGGPLSPSSFLSTTPLVIPPGSVPSPSSSSSSPFPSSAMSASKNGSAHASSATATLAAYGSPSAPSPLAAAAAATATATAAAAATLLLSAPRASATPNSDRTRSLTSSPDISDSEGRTSRKRTISNASEADAQHKAGSSEESHRRSVNHSGTQRQPQREDFATEEEYALAYGRWRQVRDRNNDAVKRSREKYRAKRKAAAEAAPPTTKETQLEMQVDMLKARLSLMAKAYTQHHSLSPEEQHHVSLMLAEYMPRR